ncbi:MAG: outer membrane protein assembly factor BamD [Pseudomonadota bacterium]
MYPRVIRFSLFAATLLTLAGCGTLKEQDETAQWSAEKIYNTSEEAAKDGNYNRANQLLERLEAKYPYGRYAQAALLRQAYNYSKTQEPALAIAALDRFIRLYPNHAAIDYAYYLKGVIHFDSGATFLNTWSDNDRSERDPKTAREAFDIFKQLVARFPDSKYAEDARSRMQFLVNSLSTYEVSVARYYMRRGAYLAVVGRAQQALKDYPKTPANEEALALLVKAYEALGVQESRQNYLQILERTFPTSRFLKDIDSHKSWWGS